MCLQFISLPSARAIVIHSSLTQERKKEWKWEQMTKGRKWEKKDPAVFFPLACWKWAKSCQEEECRPFPGAERWRGSSVWEKDRGERKRKKKESIQFELNVYTPAAGAELGLCLSLSLSSPLEKKKRSYQTPESCICKISTTWLLDPPQLTWQECERCDRQVLN